MLLKSKKKDKDLLFKIMKISKPVLIVGVIVVAIIAISALKLISSGEPGKYDDFAKCLTDNEVKIYGAYWCPHCKNQKEMFGDSWKYVDYIECSLPNNQGQTSTCKQADIKGYPTWEFKDGERLSGELSFEILSEESGCEFKIDQEED